MIVVVELQRWITRSERDAAVMEKTRGGRTGLDCRATAFAFVGFGYETRLRSDGILGHKTPQSYLDRIYKMFQD